jgi:hypothetical protein
MVEFKFVPLLDPRVTPELKARFLNLGQLVEWKLIDASGTYTGLVVIGEKQIPQGFQSMADFTLDITPNVQIPAAKAQELSRLVLNEFAKRAVIGTPKN